MKKILFVLVFFIFGFISINAQTLTVSPNTLTIATPANSTGKFNITSNSNWTATSSQSWLTVLVSLLYVQSGQNYATIPYSGNAPDLGAFEVLQNFASGNGNAIVKLTAQADPSNINRTATITITGTGLPTQIVTVTQGTNVTPPVTVPATIFSYNKK